MPIKNFNQEIIGVFQVLNKFDEYFTPDDEDLLIAIASSAGISLENAQLFERQRKLLEEQMCIRDSSRSFCIPITACNRTAICVTG